MTSININQLTDSPVVEVYIREASAELGEVSIIRGGDVDHISLTSTVGLTKTYTIWGDLQETINLGTFEISDGASAYQIDIDTGGFVGTQEEWLESLRPVWSSTNW